MALEIEVRLFNKVDGGKRSFVTSDDVRGKSFSLGELKVDLIDVPTGAKGVYVAGKPTRGIGDKGQAKFSLPAGSSVCDLKIWFQPNILYPPQVRVRQRLAIASSGALSPLPPPPDDEPDIFAGHGSLHPRLVLEKKLIWLDVTFLDRTHKDRMQPRGPYNVDRRSFEYTAGKPVVWVASVPSLKWPATAKRSPLNALVFYRPAIKPYKNHDNCSLSAVFRYLDGPSDPQAPFFVNQNYNHPKLGSLPALVAYPDCEFERQIAEGASEKAGHVVLVYPVPHGIKFHDAMSARLPELLESLRRALASSVLALVQARGLELARIAIAGFSQGGPSAFATSQTLGAKVNDLYLFDTEQFDGMTKTLLGWIKAGTNRRLRLIGGIRHDKMLAFEKQAKKATLPSGNAVSVWPAAPTFWDSSSWTAVLDTGKSASQLSAAPPSAANTALSDDSGMFYVGKVPRGSGTRLESYDEKGVLVGTADVPCNRAEATLHIRFWGGDRNEVRWFAFKEIKSPADAKERQRWTSFREMLRLKVLDSRHQWTVIGGEGAVDRGPKFKGYLRMCIDGSIFE